MYIRIMYSDSHDSVFENYQILDLTYVNDQLTFSDEFGTIYVLDKSEFYRFDVFIGKIGDFDA